MRPPRRARSAARPQRATKNLLDRLLYKGVLPRYAFPTDVVSFYVFDRDRSTRFRPEYRYAPSQGLPTALTQYAPGKRVWIDGKEWRSGALYSPMFERSHPGLARATRSTSNAPTAATQPPRARRRLNVARSATVRHAARSSSVRRRTGCDLQASPTRTAGEEETSVDDQPALSYATRAKLMAAGPPDEHGWRPVTDGIRTHYARTQLLVTNTGPRDEGYDLLHPVRPHRTDRDRRRFRRFEPSQAGSERPRAELPGAVTRGLVLGTDFISDVLLIRLAVAAPITLRPGALATDVALRTLAEAVTLAATKRLQIDGRRAAGRVPAGAHAGRSGGP